MDPQSPAPTRAQAVPSPPRREIVVAPTLTGRLARLFVVVLAVLAAGHLVAMLWSDVVGHLSVLSLVQETSVGTWVTSMVHALCAILATIGARLARREGSRWAPNWYGLAALFALMSLDEVAAIHERFSTPVRQVLGTGGGPLYYAWVIPALLFGLVFLLVQVGFLRSLDTRTRRNLILAGLLFVAGAAGLEMVEAVLETQGLQHGVAYLSLVLVEELLELGAIMWVACTLVGDLLRRVGQVRLQLGPPSAG
ncbi:hypothetical protein [uncultured Cellulomonas sp.]|uniref:hypothetical protein n=1 Tax=uncultured Cellulomonas sp. TaxID=189682 RepID=UPI00260B0D97|nr:hypothetical protein [uncultured Cellulomonas sp.]